MVYEVRESSGVYPQEGLVLDNSVCMRWLISSGKPADQRYARAVKVHIQQHRPQVLVPYLWTYEAANVVAQYVRLGELEFSVASNTLIALHDLFSISIERETPLALFEAAQGHGVTAYDAAYLLMARNTGVPLATLDKKMRKIAVKMGITLFAAEKRQDAWTQRDGRVLEKS